MKFNNRIILISHLIFIVILLLIISCSEQENSKNNNLRKIRFKTENPQKQYIKIINNGSKNASFSLKLNNNLIFSNISEIVKDIEAVNGDNKEEPIQKKVWIYLDKYSDHDYPLTERFWYHNPIIFINSLGFGFCDDVSMVSYYLWNEIGMEARVFGYQGHVVSEVLANNRWELYDVDKSVYYYNENKEIAGIDEIIKNPKIITSPIQPLYNDDIAVENLYSTRYYDFLANPKAYSIDPPKDIIKDFNFKFLLAPRMQLSLPFKFIDRLETTINSSSRKREGINSYLNLKISMPPNMKMVFQYPLLLHDIKGQGEFIYRNSSLSIGSKQLKYLLTSWENPVIPFQITSYSDLELYFLINPYRFSLEEDNELILSGNNLDSLEFKIITIK